MKRSKVQRLTCVLGVDGRLGGAGRNGQKKDTAANIHATGEFVVNVVDEPLLDAMHRSAVDFPSDVDEMEWLELPGDESDLIAPLRVASSPISMECVLDRSVMFGRSGSEFILGEIKIFHICEELLADGKVDSERLRPLARLAGPVYGKLGKIVRVRRS